MVGRNSKLTGDYGSIRSNSGDGHHQSNNQVEIRRSPDLFEQRQREQRFTESQGRFQKIVADMDKYRTDYPDELKKAGIVKEKYDEFKTQFTKAMEQYLDCRPHAESKIDKAAALRTLEFASKGLSELKEKWDNYMQKELFSLEETQFKRQSEKMRPSVKEYKDLYKDLKNKKPGYFEQG